VSCVIRYAGVKEGVDCFKLVETYELSDKRAQVFVFDYYLSVQVVYELDLELSARSLRDLRVRFFVSVELVICSNRLGKGRV